MTMFAAAIQVGLGMIALFQTYHRPRIAIMGGRITQTAISQSARKAASTEIALRQTPAAALEIGMAPIAQSARMAGSEIRARSLTLCLRATTTLTKLISPELSNLMILGLTA
jgi:hypothetical protein